MPESTFVDEYKAFLALLKEPRHQPEEPYEVFTQRYAIWQEWRQRILASINVGVTDAC